MTHVDERSNGETRNTLHTRRLAAAHEIAVTEADVTRTTARELSMPSLDGLSGPERIARLAVHKTFYEITEGQGMAPQDAQSALELFTETDSSKNATLARIEMEGQWDRAEPVQSQLVSMLIELYGRGYKDVRLIGPDGERVKHSLHIYACYTEQFGFVALRRKRTLVIASHEDPEAIRPHLEVDKVSTFALDIAQLNTLSSDAAAEVRLIVASAMFQECDLDLLRSVTDTEDDDTRRDLRLVSGYETMVGSAFEQIRKVRAIMQRYGIAYDDLMARSFGTPNPNRIQNIDGIAFVEQAIKDRSTLLTPASTTYYVHS